MERAAPPAPSDFIRDIVARDLGDQQARRARRHALSARAERLPAHRSRQVDLPQLRHRAGESAASATCASTTPIRPRRTSSTSSRSRRTCAGSASTGRTSCSTPPTTSTQLYDYAVQLIRSRQGVRRQPERRRDPRLPRHAHRARPQQPLSRSLGRGEPATCSPRMRAGEFADGAHVLRAKIDMASPNMNLRDPTIYRINARAHHRTGDAWCIYPMYDYRARALGRDRGHHALDLHARVRGPPPALRLGARQPAGARPTRSRSSSRAST